MHASDNKYNNNNNNNNTTTRYGWLAAAYIYIRTYVVTGPTNLKAQIAMSIRKRLVPKCQGQNILCFFFLQNLCDFDTNDRHRKRVERRRNMGLNKYIFLGELAASWLASGTYPGLFANFDGDKFATARIEQLKIPLKAIRRPRGEEGRCFWSIY